MSESTIHKSGSSENPHLVLIELYAEMISFQNYKDLQGVLDCIHSESMSRFNTKQLLEPLFNLFTLNNTIVSHSYIATDSEYIYYRFRQKIVKVAGPDFRDMLSDNLVLFRQENREWKIWDQLVLTMQSI